ncbi:MAG TPA: trehalose-6-phosphate synthase [Acidimicrobiia bacterium]|nr:trehalose-6-phosphate synthase [Acidimicrobiia bacterium]
MSEHAQLVIVANRLPVQYDDETGKWATSPGGLVSALAPVLRQRKGTWIGWPGTHGQELAPFRVDDIDQIPVALSAEEVADYYEGFCNGTIWPLYHDAIRPVEMHRHWWRPFQEVNRRFAETVAGTAVEGASVWVQDYQLQLVPEMLHLARPDLRIGFFLHIPFPPVEIFGRLPWRRELVRGLLGADVVGFHTRQSMTNFARAARRYGSATGPAEALTFAEHTTRAEVLPISIDFYEFEAVASTDDTREAASELRSELGDPDFVLLGVDRLDYTKGIDLRLRAFESLLESRPDLHGRIVLVQVAVPSREAVGEYRTIRRSVEQNVGRINGAFGRSDWTPVRYYYRGLDRPDLIAHYVAADVLLVTPLRDGMNLVAKEYVACRIDDTGVLVLSEFAGAAEQLEQAVIVNPYDLDGLARALGEAVDMGSDEQRHRMRALRTHVRRWDVHAWAGRGLAAIS